MTVGAFTLCIPGLRTPEYILRDICSLLILLCAVSDLNSPSLAPDTHLIAHFCAIMERF